MLLSNHIAAFLNFNITKKLEVNLLKLQIDDVILGGCGQTCSGMSKEAIKT